MPRSLLQIIREGRQALERDLAAEPSKRYISPIAYSQHMVTLPLLLRTARGRLIDLGCGNMPFRAYVVGQVTSYDGLDLYPRGSDVAYVGDVQNMPMIPNESYDTALCLEVLEHVPNPFAAVREIHRILKPGGHLVMSVPHLSRLHDEPHDYYRYTRHGVRRLLEQAGFEVVALEKRGSLLSFLGHQLSTVLLSLAWGMRPLHRLAWTLNEWTITRPCSWLDRHIDRAGVFAVGYSAVGLKLTE